MHHSSNPNGSMSTLKSFQAEIEQISSEKQKLALREAREAHAAAELARHHGKISVKKEVDNGDGTNNGDGADNGDEVKEEPIEVSERCGSAAESQDFIAAESDTDELRSRLAASLLRGHGELLIPLGAHPSPTHQYNPPTTPVSSIPTTGKPLTTTSLNAALNRLRHACEAMKAELNELYRVEQPPDLDGPYGCWQVRLTPRGVEEIMEVRVAVVGNVDAGKSTTLGVLTRGGLDDGRGKVSSILVAFADRLGSSGAVPTSSRDRDWPDEFCGRRGELTS